jgi:hypothetical protein
MNILGSIRIVFKKLRSDPFATDIFRATSGVIFFVAFASWAIEYAASRHWSLGVLLTVASGVLVMWIAKQAASSSMQHPISMVMVFFLMLVLLGAVVFAGISLILHNQGWASYDVSQQVTITTFRNFYLWTFVDMVPAIDIWKTFPVKSPVEPIDAVAGAPVLVFRLFILGFVFASVRRWWKLQAVGNPNESRTDDD